MKMASRDASSNCIVKYTHSCVYLKRDFLFCAHLFFRKRNSNSSKYTGQNSKKLSVLLAFLSFLSMRNVRFFLLIHYF